MYIDLILRNMSRFADMLFTYRLPSDQEDKIRIGHRVSIPFGRSNKPIEAFVVAKRDSLGPGDIGEDKIKEIFEILDVEPMLSQENIRLIMWIRNRYMCTYMDALNLFYPKGYRLEAKKVEKDGQVVWTYKDKKNEKKLSYLSLRYDLDTIDRIVGEKRYRLGPKQVDIIKFLGLNKSVESRSLMEILGVSNQTIKSLVDKDFIEVKEENYYRRSEARFRSPVKKISLNKDQVQVVDQIKEGFFLDEKKPYLLHGVTGSGKTEVYMELIEYSLNQGLDSILLVPEIALTPQMIARVKARFGDIVGVFHSGLSEGQKHDVYREIKNGNIRVTIGTRSALFLPFRSLGLIIIDEEHDMSYHSEMTPKYSTIEVARYMSLRQNICLVMGSATPSVADYYRADHGEYRLLELNNRANERAMPQIEIVDMKAEINRGNRSEISRVLEDEIVRTVNAGNQAILFLNRRGYASSVTCRECGHVIKCKRCDISLTYHKFKNKGLCHYCGHEEDIPSMCPECSSTNIGVLGLGTEKIEEYINKKEESNCRIKSWFINGEINPDRREIMLEKMFQNSIYSLIAKYSAGYPIEELYTDYYDALEYMHQSWMVLDNRAYLKDTKYNHYFGSDYDLMLWMLSLGYLLDVEKQKYILLLEILDRFSVKDLLYETIIKAKISERPPITEESYKMIMDMPWAYESLRHAVKETDDEYGK